MRVLGAAELLSLWERGMSRHALDRAALLAATFAFASVSAIACGDKAKDEKQMSTPSKPKA
jgi:hypothetical protein